MATTNPAIIQARIFRGFILVAFGIGRAHGACPLDVGHLRVGDDATYCTHSNIQAAIDAIANSCPVIIDITTRASGSTYADQACDPNHPSGCHLAISGKNVTLQGHGADESCYTLTQCIPGPYCAPPSSTAPLVTLDGGNAGRVLDIAGSNVNLRNLMISHGSASMGGGAIRFTGAGNLNITRSTLSLNSADYGGAINMNGAATLRLQSDTLLVSNTAQTSGGGIYLGGGARLLALSPQTWIALNEATGGYGGGVAIVGPARADLASPGYNGAGVVSYNSAVNGGGVSISPDESASATLRIFTTDPDNPVQIENNTATARGGAVYVDSANFANGRFCAFDFRLHDNAAADGAAIYSNSHSYTFDPDSGGELYFNTTPLDDSYCGPESPPSLGAVACAKGVACDEVSANRAVDANAQPTTGAIIRLNSAGVLRADPVAFRGNAASELLRVAGTNGDAFTFDVLLRNCLIAENHTQHELLSIRDGRELALDGCTIAGNTIDNGYMIYANVGGAGLQLVNSILDQPGISVLDYVGDNGLRDFAYLIANETMTLAGAAYSQGNTPLYADAANGDYHLRSSSPGIDYAPAAPAGTDLDRLPRTKDLAVANLYGPRDLGAYERQSLFDCDMQDDAIFCSGFEL